MTGFDLTQSQENQLLRDLEELESRRLSYQAKATPQLAQQVGSFYRDHPYAPPGVILAAANAVNNGMMGSEQASNLIFKAAQNQLSAAVKEPKKKKSWWQRNVADKVKAGSRWTMAGLNFVPQVLTNTASQIFKDDPSGEGFFISTDLGTLIRNDEVAGDGWFMGGRAMELQAERARQYRGEIDGHAWTLGRGAASLFLQPGSKPYNILSGVVDAAAAIATPVVPAPAGKVAGAVSAGLGNVGFRTLAGLTDFESAVIIPAKVEKWLQTSGGKAIIKKISEIETMDDALATFKNVQHMDFINKIIDLKDEVDITDYLMQTLGKPVGGLLEAGKGVSTIDQINISRLSDVKQAMAGRSSFIGKMMAAVPGNHIVLQGGNPRDVANSVRNLNGYMKLLKVDPNDRDRLIKTFSKALTENNGNIYSVVREFDDIMVTSLRAMGVPDDAISDLRSTMKDLRGNKDVWGAISGEGKPTAYNARIPTADGKIRVAPSSTAGTQGEMLNQASMILPDPQRVRRMMSQVGWIYGKGQLFKRDAKEIGQLKNSIAVLRKDADDEIAALKATVKEGADKAEVTEKIKLIQNKTNAAVKEIDTQIAGLQGPRLSDPSLYGKLRLPLSALEGFQQEIWRPVTLLTGGYVLRNMMDSAFRYSMTPGLKGGVLHPIQWIQVATNSKFRGTLSGVKWAELTPEAAEMLAREGADEFFDAIGQQMRETFSSKAMYQQAYMDKHWEKATRTSGTSFRKGVQDEVDLLFRDEAFRLVAQEKETEEIVRELMAAGPQKSGYVSQLQGRWSNQEMYEVGGSGRKAVASPNFIDSTGKFTADTEQGLTWYIDEYVRPRLQEVTGGHPTLREAIANGKLVADDGTEIPLFKLSASQKTLGYSDEYTAIVEKIVREDADRIARGEPGILKDWYKTGVELKAFAPGIPGRELPNWLRSWNKTTDKFFASLYPKRSSYLMQSPVFRQYYWQEVGKLADELDLQGLNLIKNNFIEAAAKEGKQFDLPWLESWAGDPKVAKKLFDRINNPSTNGKISLSQIDAYAKGSALDQTKNLFYNASEKSNFADVLRIVVPFGSAWAEVMSSWTKIAVSNPQAVRRVGVTVQGLQKADPDGDGKGFFWKDPVTGDYVFNYPFSEQIGGLAAALTPIGAAAGGVAFGLPGILGGAAAGAAVGTGLQKGLGLEATRIISPVQSLSMGLNIYPGAGPFVQIAANKILAKTPKADFIRDAILPYGEPDISTIGPIPVPSWGRKVIDAIIGDKDNSRLLGDLTIDVMRLLHASGDYDLSKAEERDRLENDSVTRARTLLVLRGFGQLIGPTRPDIEFEVATKQGDKYTVELAKAFRDMQAENFETAVERFISTFGEDAFLYVQGKTEAVAGGLDASKKFGRFERENTALFNRYPEVAGYFAPVASNFDYAVYTRQIETGKRRKLTPTEFLDLAQQNVARSLYKSTQRAIGANPNEYQKESLRQVKALLEQRYPAYAKVVIDINAQKGRIKELERALSDPMLDNNPIAEAARVYFKYRNQTLQELANRGIVSGDLTVKKAVDLREYLRNVADVLVERYPEFERLYDRLLYSEVEGM